MKFQNFRHILTPENLSQFKLHKYDCRGKGIIENFVDMFASKVVVPLLPQGLAPNMITLIGFVVHLIAAMLVIFNDDASFAYLISNNLSGCYIFSLLFYCVMDSADGAQARRLGCSSPLGELFDHGFDALTMGGIVLSVSSLLRYSYFKNRLLLMCLGGNVLFFMFHWRAYVFGYLQFGKVSAVEGQFFVMSLFVMNILAGFDFFWLELPTFGSIQELFHRRLEVADYIFFTICLFALFIIFKMLYDIYAIQGKVTYAGLATNGPLTWLFSVVLVCLVNYWIVSYFIYDFIPHFFFIVVIAPLAKLSWATILCYMSKSPIPAIDTCIIPPLCLFSWFVLLRFSILTSLNPNFVFNGICILSLCDFGYFALSNMLLISRELGIPLLTVSSYRQLSTTLPL